MSRSPHQPPCPAAAAICNLPACSIQLTHEISPDAHLVGVAQAPYLLLAWNVQCCRSTVNTCSILDYHDTLPKLQLRGHQGSVQQSCCVNGEPITVQCILVVHCVWVAHAHMPQSTPYSPGSHQQYWTRHWGCRVTLLPFRSGLQCQLLLTVCGDNGNAVQAHLWL